MKATVLIGVSGLLGRHARTGELLAGLLRAVPFLCFSSRSRFLGRGCDEALFRKKKQVFSEKSGGIQ